MDKIIIFFDTPLWIYLVILLISLTGLLFFIIKGYIKHLDLEKKSPLYSIRVDYDVSIDRLVELARFSLEGAKNNHHGDNKFGTKFFNCGETKKIVIKFIRFDHVVSISETIKLIKETEYRPATLGEVLTLYTHWKAGMFSPIVAAGSNHKYENRGEIVVPYIYRTKWYEQGEMKFGEKWIEAYLGKRWWFAITKNK